MTAFALETLALASQPEYEHILFIDVDVMNELASWLLTNQNKATGAFEQFAPVEFDIRLMVCGCRT